MLTHETDRLAATLAALLDTPRVLEDLRRQVADLTAAVRTLEAALPPMLVDAETAGKALGRSPSTIRSWASRGLIPSVRVGRSHRIDLTKLRGLDASEIARLARGARSR
jgi:hypothetical protein